MKLEDVKTNLTDESRRSFMKKGALASGAIALGAAGSGTAAATATQQQQATQVLVFAYDYQPGMSFTVVSQFQQSIVDAILGTQQDGDGQQGIVSDPADYNGYLVAYQADGGTRGEYVLVFVRDGVLQSNQQYQFSGDVSFFSTQANLLQATITAGGGGGNGGGN